MATYNVTGPDGSTYKVTAPDDASHDDIIAFAQQQVGHHEEAPAAAQQEPAKAPPTKQDVQSAMLRRQVMGAAPFFGQHMPDVMMGARQVVDAGAQMLGRLAGSKSADETNKAALDAYEKDYQPDLYSGSSAARGVGQAIATAPAMGVKAATTLPRMMAQGAALGGATGALTPAYDAKDDFWQEKAKQAGVGALAGGAASGLIGGLGRVISPEVAPEAKKLLDAGVTPTPGQLMGGGWKRAEEGLTSVPLLGDVIKKAQGRGLEDFNRAVYMRTLAPLGKEGVAVAKSAPVGNEGIAKVGDFLSSQYDNVLSKVTVKIDDGFMRSNLQLNEMVKTLPETQRAQFGTYLQRVWNEFTPGGLMTGESMKGLESKLGSVARQYKGSGDPDQRMLADAVSQLQSNLRSLVARSEPSLAPRIRAIDQGWSNLTQLENAGAMLGAKEGAITPAQYLNAVKKSDNSVRDRQFARGNARNQDLAQAADKVLSRRTPDSGTPFRAMMAMGAGGGLGALGLAHPGAAAAGGLAMLPYTPMGQKIMAALLTKRPESAALLGNPLKRVAPYLGLMAPAGLLGP